MDVRNRVRTALLTPISRYTGAYAYTTRLNVALARGALTATTRRVDPLHPLSWEFAAFSQNGEDGIIDHLLSLIASPSRYFLEIGASDGLENNSAYLAFAKRYAGVMVEGDKFLSDCARTLLGPLNTAVGYLNLFVENDNVDVVLNSCHDLAPDLLSLDIDGNDYHVALACLSAGLRPLVICVEYNSAFGPTRALSIPYTSGFDNTSAHPSPSISPMPNPLGVAAVSSQIPAVATATPIQSIPLGGRRRITVVRIGTKRMVKLVRNAEIDSVLRSSPIC